MEQTRVFDVLYLCIMWLCQIWIDNEFSHLKNESQHCWNLYNIFFFKLDFLYFSNILLAIYLYTWENYWEYKRITRLSKKWSKLKTNIREVCLLYSRFWVNLVIECVTVMNVFNFIVDTILSIDGVSDSIYNDIL